MQSGGYITPFMVDSDNVIGRVESRGHGAFQHQVRVKCGLCAALCGFAKPEMGAMYPDVIECSMEKPVNGHLPYCASDQKPCPPPPSWPTI